MDKYFWMDDTLQYANVSCLKCHCSSQTVVSYEMTETKMYTYFGCKKCRFIWFY